MSFVVGGDPLVFGGGGEGPWCLRMQGLRFEIISGIISAIAAPAYVASS
jgi:siroheme synthase